MWLPLFAGVKKKIPCSVAYFFSFVIVFDHSGSRCCETLSFTSLSCYILHTLLRHSFFSFFFRYYITVRPPVYIGTLEYSYNPKEIFGIVTATTTSVNNAADSIRNEIAKQTMNSALSSYGNCMFGPMKPSKVWNQFETTRNSIFRLCVRVFFFVLSFRFSFVENLKKKCDKSNLVNAESVYKFQKLK